MREFIFSHTQNVAGPASNEKREMGFNELALTLFRLQFEAVPAYQRFCRARGMTPESARHWSEIPAIPTAAFKDFDLSGIPASDRTAVFHSSGTTEHRPSRHFHNGESLRLYEASLLPWFQKHLLGDWEDLVRQFGRPGMIILTPPSALAPNSSLVYMFETVRRKFGSSDSLFAGKLDAAGGWVLEIDAILFALRESMRVNKPIAILGTAFSFVHLLDHLTTNHIHQRLAAGSRVLETGGYKGRSRMVPTHELHGLITARLGVPPSHIVSEYGMSELSSQAYDRVTGPAGAREDDSTIDERERLFRFPPWARSEIISPETGKPVREGETGLMRVFDLANAQSVLAVQTEDLAVRQGDGFQVLGRAATSEARGCSLLAT